MTKRQEITACAFLHKDNKLFIAKRADTKSFLPGKWELPGGHIDHGESLPDGLNREFQEEFSTAITVGRPFYEFTYRRDKDGVDVHVIEVIIFSQLQDGQEIKLDPAEHSEYKWLAEDEIDQYLDPDEEETHAVHEGFKLLAQGIQ